MFIYLYVFLVVILFPTLAHAWGPATHIDLALSILSAAPLLTPVIRKIITSHQDAFIYGTASPDIIMGKKHMDYLYNGHNWKVAWKILEKSKTDQQKSAAYGYLLHLAADTVAHNYYIPFKIIRSFSSPLQSHTYWEMRFDLQASEAAWNKLGNLKTNEEFDSLLEKELRRFAFSFKTNKAIFKTIINIQKAKALRKRLESHGNKSKMQIEPENKEHYFNLALDASRDILTRMDASYVTFADPMGFSRIEEAKILRRQLNKRKRMGRLKENEEAQFLEIVKELLALAIYKPRLVLPHFE